MRRVGVVLEAGEERCVEDSGGELANAAADRVGEVSVDDRACGDKALFDRSFAHRFVQRPCLARLDDGALGKFGNALDVDVSTLASGVVGGETPDEIGDAKILGPCIAPRTIDHIESQVRGIEFCGHRCNDSLDRRFVAARGSKCPRNDDDGAWFAIDTWLDIERCLATLDSNVGEHCVESACNAVVVDRYRPFTVDELNSG